MEAPAQVVIGVDAQAHAQRSWRPTSSAGSWASKTLAATAEGHLTAIAWADRWPTRRWAIEDCRHLTRTFEADLLRAGEHVVRVPTQMLAGVRRSARQRGKSDAIDALAVARAAWHATDRVTVAAVAVGRFRHLWYPLGTRPRGGPASSGPGERWLVGDEASGGWRDSTPAPRPPAANGSASGAPGTPPVGSGPTAACGA